MKYNSLNGDNICALIVSFNDKHSLIKSIENALKYFDLLIIVDNGSTDGTKELLTMSFENKIKFIFLDKNYGIAYALNIGFLEAIKLEYKWVYTLDQDSAINSKTISNLKLAYQKLCNQNIGILSSKVTFSDFDEKIITKYYEKDVVITSGNLVNIYAYKTVNGFNDKLFIDNVDFDFCLKLKVSGFKIYEVNDSILLHELGKIEKFKILGLTFKIHTHNLKRKYFMSRNHIYLTNQYFTQFPLLIIKLNIFFSLFILQTILLESRKLESLKFILNGITDGIKNDYSKNYIIMGYGVEL